MDLQQTVEKRAYLRDAQIKHRRGLKSDLNRILAALPEITAELREQRRLLEHISSGRGRADDD